MMNKERVLDVINGIIDESAEYMKAEAEQLLNCREWDFNSFDDSNTFARLVMECIFNKEMGQYQAINNTKKAKDLKLELAYELNFIHCSIR